MPDRYNTIDQQEQLTDWQNMLGLLAVLAGVVIATIVYLRLSIETRERVNAFITNLSGQIHRQFSR